jgi:hypothetical protein
VSDRVDQKLQDVVVARFHYRHEAEFAAGFLDDAGIPYRLQVDDAAMGMTIATPATLWVRGMDVGRAREALGLTRRDTPIREGAPPAKAIASPGALAHRPEPKVPAHRLSARERWIAGALCAGGLGLATIAPDHTWLSLALVSALAGVMGAAALFGRTLAPIRWLLRALSGSAP